MPSTAEPRHSHALVACARWEEQDLQEWLDYHRLIGFDHVFLYGNDDDPGALLRAAAPYMFGPRPFVTFRHWPVAGQQAEMYQHFLDTFKDLAEWFAILDVDEFLVLKGSDDVGGFLAPFAAAADCVVFNSFEYGNNGKIRRDDGSVLMSHLRRAEAADARTKMICRSAAVDADAARAAGAVAGPPFWEAPAPAGLRCVNVLNRPIGSGGEDPPGALLETGYVAHFRFKSEQDFLRRAARGGLPDSRRWQAMYEAGEHRAILERANKVYDTYLAEFWHRATGPALDCMLRVPPEELPAPNVALNKPSWQSSIYEPEGIEPAGSRVAGGGNNGVRNGRYGFHTKMEASPWWVVDLLGSFNVLAVRLFNRLDNPAIAARANELDVLVSMDAAAWTVIYSRVDAQPFGGADGFPAEIHVKSPTLARFIAVRLRSRGFLHLDEVEVYGLPL